MLIIGKAKGSGKAGNGTTLALSTRTSRGIDNWMCKDALPHGSKLECEDYKKKYSNAIHRPGPCNAYNCHGLTFAARRARVVESSAVQQILDEDGYQEISIKLVLAGDIAIYRGAAIDGGEIEHSGIVVQPPQGAGIVGVPFILSKWGSCQEVLHYANDSPYSSQFIQYYRLKPLCV